jgi:hypothetical protein
MKVKVFLQTAGDGTRAQRKRHTLRCFYEGLRLAQVDVEMVDEQVYRPCDLAVVFGARRRPEKPSDAGEVRNRIMDAHGGHLIILETPLLGRSVYQRSILMTNLHRILRRGSRTFSDDYSYFRVGIDGFLADDGDFANRSSPSDRWHLLSRQLGLNLRPYRRSGQHVLLVGQNPGDASLRGLDMFDWLEQTMLDLRQTTNRPIIVRPHPVTDARMMLIFQRRFRVLPVGCKLDFPPRRPMSTSLDKCWVLVAYSSSSTIDALIGGVPAIALSSANMAWPVTDHSLSAVESPTLFAREQWLYDLAYAQWSPDEMQTGMVWRHLRPALESRMSDALEDPILSHVSMAEVTAASRCAATPLAQPDQSTTMLVRNCP